MGFRDLFIKEDHDGKFNEPKQQEQGHINLDDPTFQKILGSTPMEPSFKERKSSLTEPLLEEVLEPLAIYQWAEIATTEEKENSILAVEDFVNSLPTDMTFEVKKSSLAGILKAAKLSSDAMIEDYNNRKQALEQYLLQSEETTKTFIEETAESIETKLKEVEDLRTSMSRKKQALKQQNEMIEIEIEHIDQLAKYIS